MLTLFSKQKKTPPEITASQLHSTDYVVKHLLGHSGVPTTADGCAYEPIQRILAVSTSDGRVKVYGKEGAEIALTAATAGSATSQLQFLGNRGVVLRTCEAGHAELWSLDGSLLAADGGGGAPPVHKLKLSKDAVRAVCMVPWQPYLLVGAASGAVHVAALVNASGAPVAEARPLHGHQLMPYKITPDYLKAEGEATHISARVQGPVHLMLTLHSKSGATVWDLRAQQLVCAIGPKQPGVHAKVQSAGRATAATWLGVEAAGAGDFITGHTNGDLLVWRLVEPAARVEAAEQQPAAPAGVQAAVLVQHLRLTRGSANKVRRLECLPGKEQRLLVIGGQQNDSDDDGVLVSLPQVDGTVQVLAASKPVILGSMDSTEDDEDRSTGAVMKVPKLGAMRGHALVTAQGSASASDAQSLLVLSDVGGLVLHALQSRTKPRQLGLPFQQSPPLTCARLEVVPTERLVQPGLQALCMSGLRAWAKEQKREEVFLKKGKAAAWAAVFSGGVPAEPPVDAPTSSLYCTGHTDGLLRLWDWYGPGPLLLGTAPSQAALVALQQDVTDLAAVASLDVCWEQSILVAGHENGEVFVYLFSDQAGKSSCVHLQNIGPRAKSKAVRTDEPPGFQLRLRCSVHTAPITACRFSASSKLVVAGDKSGAVSLIDMSRPAVLWYQTPVGESIASLSVALCPLPPPRQRCPALSSGWKDLKEGHPVQCVLAVTRDCSIAVLEAQQGCIISKAGVVRPKNASTVLSLEVLDASYQPLWLQRDVHKLLPRKRSAGVAPATERPRHKPRPLARDGDDSGSSSGGDSTPRAAASSKSKIKVPVDGKVGWKTHTNPLHKHDKKGRKSAAALGSDSDDASASDGSSSDGGGHRTNRTIKGKTNARTSAKLTAAQDSDSDEDAGRKSVSKLAAGRGKAGRPAAKASSRSGPVYEAYYSSSDDDGDSLQYRKTSDLDDDAYLARAAARSEATPTKPKPASATAAGSTASATTPPAIITPRSMRRRTSNITDDDDDGASPRADAPRPSTNVKQNVASLADKLSVFNRETRKPGAVDAAGWQVGAAASAVEWDTTIVPRKSSMKNGAGPRTKRSVTIDDPATDSEGNSPRSPPGRKPLITATTTSKAAAATKAARVSRSTTDSAVSTSSDGSGGVAPSATITNRKGTQPLAAYLVICTQQYVRLYPVKELLAGSRTVAAKTALPVTAACSSCCWVKGAPVVVSVVQHEGQAMLQTHAVPSMRLERQLSLSSVAGYGVSWDKRTLGKLQKLCAVSVHGQLALASSMQELLRVAVDPDTEPLLTPSSIYDWDIAAAANAASLAMQVKHSKDAAAPARTPYNGPARPSAASLQQQQQQQQQQGNAAGKSQAPGSETGTDGVSGAALPDGGAAAVEEAGRKQKPEFLAFLDKAGGEIGKGFKMLNKAGDHIVGGLKTAIDGAQKGAQKVVQAFEEDLPHLLLNDLPKTLGNIGRAPEPPEPAYKYPDLSKVFAQTGPHSRKELTKRSGKKAAGGGSGSGAGGSAHDSEQEGASPRGEPAGRLQLQRSKSSKPAAALDGPSPASSTKDTPRTGRAAVTARSDSTVSSASDTSELAPKPPQKKQEPAKGGGKPPKAASGGVVGYVADLPSRDTAVGRLPAGGTPASATTASRRGGEVKYLDEDAVAGSGPSRLGSSTQAGVRSSAVAAAPANGRSKSAGRLQRPTQDDEDEEPPPRTLKERPGNSSVRDSGTAAESKSVGGGLAARLAARRADRLQQQAADQDAADEDRRAQLLSGASGKTGSDKTQVSGSVQNRVRSANEIRMAYGRAPLSQSEGAVDVADLMAENRQKLAQRGEQLSRLNDRAEEIRASAGHFATLAKQAASSSGKGRRLL